MDVKNKLVKLQIWDTAVHERLKILRRIIIEVHMVSYYFIM